MAFNKFGSAMYRGPYDMMERLLEEASYAAADAGLNSDELVIDAAYVDSQLEALSADEDLSRFIL